MGKLAETLDCRTNLEKSEGTSKKGSRGKTSSKKRGGGSVADKAKRVAREFFK